MQNVVERKCVLSESNGRLIFKSIKPSRKSTQLISYRKLDRMKNKLQQIFVSMSENQQYQTQHQYQISFGLSEPTQFMNIGHCSQPSNVYCADWSKLNVQRMLEMPHQFQ